MFDNLVLTDPSPLSIPSLIFNLFLGAGFSYILSIHYIRLGRTHSNRAELAQVLPFIALTTLLVITVVKSSLALSLGLVGALSIVRFRTPIKEPEELAYLFLSIAIGLGFGSDQRVATVVGVTLILVFLTLLQIFSASKQRAKHNLFLNIEVPETESQEGTLQAIHKTLEHHTRVSDMRRLDVRDGTLQATYYVDCKDQATLVALMENLKRTFAGAAISFVEQRGF